MSHSIDKKGWNSGRMIFLILVTFLHSLVFRVCYFFSVDVSILGPKRELAPSTGREDVRPWRLSLVPLCR